MIRIVTPSRIHITLIDLNGSLGRVDGGIGIALDHPSIVISAEKADEVTVEGRSALSEQIRKGAELISRNHGGIHIKVEEDIPPHVGFGSGTQAYLAGGMAANVLYGLGLSVREIAKRVQRGGTSGIGVTAFERGGFILDGGHRFDEKGFMPSSASYALPPPVLFHHDFPDWSIVLVIPPAKGASGIREVNIFKEECPIPLGEVQAISHIILMKLLPALIEKDLRAFGDSINRIQKIGFKRREVSLQPQAREIMEVLLRSGAAGAGMSSFGPLIYGITDSPSEVEKAARDQLDGRVEILTTRARNSGASIR
ncbi:MAG: beta-ribofuranosylaminobenzene 5'-phosphate synthase [Methanocellales archaeon]|nr:beta-ribofuranosylaminobenzene 5'-phosphate synthase [Methanocellales archaeon]MDD3292071.1 beta-ribofuranosylaminobenzene 5'-phosphate synthase [Methanocellales archaeon]MDD5235548.1 beta-ribofuranosylaminobenzene 5'-phosphate synthase [Methanocellales archaeon]MDD5485572.1 beta-ribofuranosylaminobenzene 5'-phosphate synthase [Methanocellales archaeon]